MRLTDSFCQKTFTNRLLSEINPYGVVTMSHQKSIVTIAASTPSISILAGTLWVKAQTAYAALSSIALSMNDVNITQYPIALANKNLVMNVC